MPCRVRIMHRLIWGFLLLLPSYLVKAGRQLLALWSPDLHPGNLLQSQCAIPDFNNRPLRSQTTPTSGKQVFVLHCAASIIAIAGLSGAATCFESEQLRCSCLRSIVRNEVVLEGVQV